MSKLIKKPQIWTSNHLLHMNTRQKNQCLAFYFSGVFIKNPPEKWKFRILHEKAFILRTSSCDY